MYIRMRAMSRNMQRMVTGGVQRNTSCWSVELAGDNTPGNEQITLMFRLANIGAPIGFDMMAGEE